MKLKLVWRGEWVRVRNMMNKHFDAAAPCSICRKMKCEPVWYSIKTHEVRCPRCFDPTGPLPRAPEPWPPRLDAGDS